jgi:hypothetical protein
MRWGLTLRALCIAAAVTACGVNHALTQEADDDQDEETSTIEKKASGWSVLFDPVISRKPAFDFLTGGMPDRLLYFTGLDIWRCGFGAYAGMQWAPKGINKDGFILRLFTSEGLERYTTHSNAATRPRSSAALSCRASSSDAATSKCRCSAASMSKPTIF